MSQNPKKSKRALISVSDKTGLVEFASQLVELGYEIISTGGTANALTAAGIPNISISQVTGFPECLDGRVKTLHPNVHAGLLARRDVVDHMQQIDHLGISPIDIVAVNLYPFRATISAPKCTLAQAVENIDIGGPTMLRSAAKNYAGVLVVVDPSDYAEVIDRLRTRTDDMDYRFMLMYKVFSHTASYDAMIAEYLGHRAGVELPQTETLTYEKICDLRYGENPHQSAAFYSSMLCPPDSLCRAVKLGGKELSYNNINDAEGALDALSEFERPTVVVVKHANPCAVASGNDIYSAYIAARAGDPVSIFGGIVAANRTIDARTASELVQTFLEIVIAPSFEPEALEILRTKPNLRILEMAALSGDYSAKRWTRRPIHGGLLVQERDGLLLDAVEARTVTVAQVTDEDMRQLAFAYKVCKHVKSNAIVIARDSQTIGIGVGQTNRIWACAHAIERAGERVRGAYLASDAFFPFADCVEAAAAAGIRAIIQPGGSVRDAESIEMCDRHGIAMIFVGIRHFRH